MACRRVGSALASPPVASAVSGALVERLHACTILLLGTSQPRLKAKGEPQRAPSIHTARGAQARSSLKLLPPGSSLFTVDG